jgi:hypothetical protein
MSRSSEEPIDDGEAARVELSWIPLGAGGRVVAFNGRLYEALSARRQRRPRADLYHAALVVHLDGDTYAIEMGPAWGGPPVDRGVTVEGPVGIAVLGRLRMFRYEVRSWRSGVIPDIGHAVASPVTVSTDRSRAARVLELAREVPPFTWGRDAVGAGEMWNSNSLVAWLLACSGHDLDGVAPPEGGRAPGWRAGLVLAGSRGPAVQDAC